MDTADAKILITSCEVGCDRLRWSRSPSSRCLIWVTKRCPYLHNSLHAYPACW